MYLEIVCRGGSIPKINIMSGLVTLCPCVIYVLDLQPDRRCFTEDLPSQQKLIQSSVERCGNQVESIELVHFA